jgi:hypothetical protein
MEIVEILEVISEAEVVIEVVANFVGVIEVVAEVISVVAAIFAVGEISVAVVVEAVVLPTLDHRSSGSFLFITPLNKSNCLIDKAKLSHHLTPPSPRPKMTLPKLWL